ncbi:MAG: hypothetical protein ACKOXO_04435 [Cyanobium sp.]
MALPFAATTALAQLSPQCERNGRREFCAVTFEANSPRPGESGGFEQPGEGEGSVGDAAGPKPLSLWVVFADHSKVKLLLKEHTCSDDGPKRRCQAEMQASPGNDHPSPAHYIGTAYEGGYRHEYTMPGLQIVFSYLD